MKGVVGYLTLAALLIPAGVSLWALGFVERRTTHVQEQLLTLRYEAPASEYGMIDEWITFAGGLPGLRRIRADIAQQHATSQYWLRDFEPLARRADALRAPAELEPQLLMTAAQAAYRRVALDGSDPDAVKRLDAILDLYGEIIKRDPQLIDAAYNFEFVARTRNAVARIRRGPARSPDQIRPPAMPRPGRTMHGDRGGVPPGLEAQEFKVIVPQPSDERQEQREAGSGTPRVRKG
jgi:hypothetical protein